VARRGPVPPARAFLIGTTVRDVTIGFLHTADVHVGTFTQLVDELSPETATRHVVDATLLADGQVRGVVDGDLRDRLIVRLEESARGSDVVVCTCSTISGAAEGLAGVIGTPFVRVDRPMAERAIATGSSIALVAVLRSTIGPTTALLSQAADARGVQVSISPIVCEDAWQHFQSGRMDDYLCAVAAAVDAIDFEVDAVVLAQASMAPASRLTRISVPVLSSPRLAVEAALALVGKADRPMPSGSDQSGLTP